MAILGYALEYAYDPSGAHILAFNRRNVLCGWKPRNGRKYAPGIFLREDYGSYNVLIFRLLRYL